MCVCVWLLDDEDKSMHGKGVAFMVLMDGYALDGWGGVKIFALVYRFCDTIWLQWNSCTLCGYLETCAPSPILL